MAKPIEGVAGSGEHTHVNVTAKLKNGKMINLFAPADMKKDFLSPIGWGALMGLLKNYEVINPFISSGNDALNRLKPGFEAPICIVASLGKSVEAPSRNRTVLAGLVRDMSNPLSVRFEVRSPNPHTNTYLAAAAIFQAMLDGIKYAVRSGKSVKELEKEFNKKSGDKAGYLETGRAYRSEEDVFEHYSEDERNIYFGKPPVTVWDNLCNLTMYPQKTAVLSDGDVFEKNIIDSYISAVRQQWLMELSERIIAENLSFVKSCYRKHKAEDSNEYDEQLWISIDSLRHTLMKDSLNEKSLFSRLHGAIDSGDYDRVSSLQQEMFLKIDELKKLYMMYKKNIMDN
jgi:glutamine synthetase